MSARIRSTSSLRPNRLHRHLERVRRAVGSQRDRFAVEDRFARRALLLTAATTSGTAGVTSRRLRVNTRTSSPLLCT